MDDVAKGFRNWLDGRTLRGASMRRIDENRWTLTVGAITARVIISRDRNHRDVAQLLLTRASTREPSFRARFPLDDGPRAKKLVREMMAALDAESLRADAQVLVCHAPNENIDAFVHALNECAAPLAVPYAFEAASLNETLVRTGNHTAVLLTPMAEALRTSVRLARPDCTTFVIPSSVLVHRDAQIAMNLLNEALCEVNSAPCTPNCRRSLRPFPGSGLVLIANITYCDRCVRMGYRVYEGDVVRARGAMTKARLDLHDIQDFLSTLEFDDIEISELEAIGLTTPGVVNSCSMNLPSLGLRDVDLTETLSACYGIPVFLDNSTNAASMGCYLLHPDCHSLTLYRHQLGHKNGGQGTVIDGKLVTGHSNMAGEPKFYQRMFCYEGGYASAVWSSQGLSLITRNVLLASIGTISPDVACIAVNAIDDIDDVRNQLERSLPQYCIPELVRVDDYRDCMYLGEAALCLERIG